MGRASKRNLKIMISQFRIIELQKLLHTFGETNVKLRKNELQKKAMELIHSKKSRLLSTTVINLHKKMNSSRRSAEPTYNLRDSKNRYASYRDDSPLYDDDFYSPDPFGVDHFSDYKNTQPLDLSGNSSYLSTFEHLDVERIQKIKFPALPFYLYISDIMLVTPLVPNSESDALFEYRCSFGLNSNSSYYLFNIDAIDAKYEALLRLCLINDKFEVEDALPQKLYVSINDRFCSCVPDNFSGKPDSSGKRVPGVPMNITPYIRDGVSMHKLVIHWSVSYHLVFAATIQLVKKRDADELIENLVRKGEQDPAVSKKFIYDNLNDEDNEIAATSLKMSLICPLGKMLMTLPARGTTCNHLQCFDGALYIKMNEIKSTWQCPVCSQSCLFENLFVDGYFMDILRSKNFSSDIRDIQLSADGTWEPALSQETKKRPKRCSPSPVTVVENKKTRADEQSCNEILPDVLDSDLLRTSIVDDLREIFSDFISSRSQQYPEFTVNDSIFSGECSDGGNDGRGGTRNFASAILSPELSSVSASSQTAKRRVPTYPESASSQTMPAEKKVLLVDLTLSDSESDCGDDDDDDDIRSTSSSSSSSSSKSVVPETPSFYIDRVRNDSFPLSNINYDLCAEATLRNYLSPPESSPPVYDIDDSDG